LVGDFWRLLHESCIFADCCSPLLFFFLFFGKSRPLVTCWVYSAINPIENIIDKKPLGALIGVHLVF
jgi:hypothetical protein